MSSETASQASVQRNEVNDSAATSVNGSTSTNETTTNTEISSVTEENSVVKKDAPVSTKPASAPPKVNPWKTRAETSATSRVQEPSSHATVESQSQPAGEASQGSTIQESNGANGHVTRRTHRPSRSTAPAIDDASLWPTLDKAVVDGQDSGHKKSNVTDSVEGGVQSAPKVTGKEKWTKYTPTIIHAPIPSKSIRGGAAGAAKATGRGGSAQRPGRESASSEKTDFGAETSSKYSRSSETSRPRTTKARSMSVSNTRSERVARRESQPELELPEAVSRSQSTKRSDHGSISAPSGTTPVSDASKSPQIGGINGAYGDISGMSNGAEPRVHRGSYDSNFNTRPRGGYRGTRGNYQSNYNTRYQNPANFVSQPHLQNNRIYQRDQMPYGFDQYQNFVNPAIAPVMIDPMTARHMVLNQCEYYFSIENLCKDLFLRKHMDSQGFVNLPILANFNRVRAITLDYALIRDVCVMSSLIELRAQSGSYDKIRRVEGWEQWVLPEDQRDPSTRAVPDIVPEIPVSTGDEPQADMSSNIGARAFVPGQSSHEAQSATTTLNENFSNLGIGSGRRLSPEVKEFQSRNTSTAAE